MIDASISAGPETVRVVQSYYPCLFRFAQNTICAYNPYNPPIYFSLGEAISAFGLIFAVYQLKTRAWDIAFYIQGPLKRYLFGIFGLLGLLFVLVSSVIPQLSLQSDLPFYYPIFWEIAGFACFILSPMTLVWIGSRSRNLLTKETSVRFFEAMVAGISSHRTENFEAAISIFGDNLPRLVSYARALENLRPDERNIPDELRYAQYAASTLNVVLSEKRVADYIVTSRIDLLVNFIQLVKKERLDNHTIEIGFGRLMGRLFQNPDSYFYTQLDYRGIYLYVPIFQLIFSDIRLVSDMYILSQWSPYSAGELKFNKKYIKVMKEALKTSIEAYGFGSSGSGISGQIGAALNQFAKHTTTVAREVLKEKEKLTDKSWLIDEIGNFFGIDFPQSYKRAVHKGAVSGREQAPDYRQDIWRGSLANAYAKSLTEFLEALAILIDRDEMVRVYAQLATNGIFDITDEDIEIKGVRDCLIEIIWEKLKDNVENGHYPALFRVYIALFYFILPSGIAEWYLSERNRLIQYMYDELKPRILNGEKMKNGETKEEALLPSYITLNRETLKFESRYHSDQEAFVLEKTIID